MKNSKVLKTFLVVSGLLLAFIGSATLFMPTEIKAGSGIEIGGDVNLLNDVRASAALLLMLAILTITGGFYKKLTFTSSLVSFLTFLAIGTGRVISIISDGMPVEGVVKATVLEFILGTAGLILFMIYREKNND